VYNAERFSFENDLFNILSLKFSQSQFIDDSEGNDYEEYILTNGDWVLDTTDTNSPIVLSENDTVATINGIHTLTIESVEDLEGKTVQPIRDSNVLVLMPAGSEKVIWNHSIATDAYLLDERSRTHGNIQNQEFYQSFAEILVNQCGTHYFNYIEHAVAEGIAFTCGQESQTTGTLVAVKPNGDLIENVGTWEIIDLPGSTIPAIVTLTDSSYLEDDDSSQALFAMKGSEVWRGYYGTNPPLLEQSAFYNQAAFDAVEAKLL
jgi:hypothetical protein